mmetsp:Transcript_36867/g.72384  ORF Transcript_36867/g.72384 Transcript_36867/m.72384 type:complete len:139 (-) Transcript_36867:992-1408(-)
MVAKPSGLPQPPTLDEAETTDREEKGRKNSENAVSEDLKAVTEIGKYGKVGEVGTHAFGLIAVFNDGATSCVPPVESSVPKFALDPSQQALPSAVPPAAMVIELFGAALNGKPDGVLLWQVLDVNRCSGYGVVESDGE